MSLDHGMRWKESEEAWLRKASEDGRPMEDMAERLHRPKKSIMAKLREMNLPMPQPAGVERKCSNWNSWERPCKNTFVSKYAGPCQRCRGIESATVFELPASLM